VTLGKERGLDSGWAARSLGVVVRGFGFQDGWAAQSGLAAHIEGGCCEGAAVGVEGDFGLIAKPP
jgi:hypothetical protein